MGCGQRDSPTWLGWMQPPWCLLREGCLVGSMASDGAQDVRIHFKTVFLIANRCEVASGSIEAAPPDEEVRGCRAACPPACSPATSAHAARVPPPADSCPPPLPSHFPLSSAPRPAPRRAHDLERASAQTPILRPGGSHDYGFCIRVIRVTGACAGLLVVAVVVEPGEGGCRILPCSSLHPL